jgi:serine/threonine protein kinase
MDINEYKFPLEFTINNVLYRWISFIGKGTYGAVSKYNRIYKDTSDLVAIKKFISNISNEYENEVKSLNHIKNICFKYAVCIYDHFIYNDDRYIVMEYINGISVLDYIKNNSLNDRCKISQITFDLLGGLLEFNRYNIIHQDIKEGNIMYDVINKRYRFIDWGGSCLKDSSVCNRINALYITSPEKLQGIQYNSFEDNFLQDVWSLGVVLYDFYSANTAYDLSKYYIKKGQLNTQTALSYKSAEYLQMLIQNLNVDLTIKYIISLLLQPDINIRRKNWEKLMVLGTDLSLKVEIDLISKLILEITDLDDELTNLLNMDNTIDKLNKLHKFYNSLNRHKSIGFEVPNNMLLYPINKKCANNIKYHPDLYIVNKFDTNDPNTYWCFSEEDLKDIKYIDSNKFINPFDKTKTIILLE